MLPDIGRARYHWLNIVVDQTFTSVGVELRAHLFIDHHHVMVFFFVCSIFVVGLDSEIILTAKFS